MVRYFLNNFFIRWILFTSFSDDPNGNLVLISSMGEKGNNTIYPVTAGNAIDGQGKWSKTGETIVFRRIDTDVDNDGKIAEYRVLMRITFILED